MELSICIGIGDCVWPSSCNVCHTGATSFALMYSDPNLASTVDNMTTLITCEILWIVTCLGERWCCLIRKNDPHSASCLWFTLIGDIALYCQDHAACIVCDCGFAVFCDIVQKLLSVLHHCCGWFCLLHYNGTEGHQQPCNFLYEFYLFLVD